MKQLLLYALLSIPIGLYCFFCRLNSAPETIKARALTPGQLDEQFKAEQKQENYDTAEEVAARVLKRHGCSDEYAELIGHASVDERVSPRIVAATVIVESTCRSWAVSYEGAVGLMQVMPKIWNVRARDLKRPEVNIPVGTHILAAFIRAYGVREGLHHYNGMGIGCDACDSEYSRKVMRVAGYV